MATAGVRYQVRLLDLHAHLFRVTLSVAEPAALQRLSLPVWIPGSYLVREFSKNLQRLRAHQGSREVALTQLDKCSWQAECDSRKPLLLSYEVYAFDNSVRTAWLDASRGFFNGSSLFLQVQGQEQAPHKLELLADKSASDWQVATGLAPDKIKKMALAVTWPPTTTNWSTARWKWVVSGAAPLSPVVSSTVSSSPVRHPVLTAPDCWPTHRKSARPKSASGTA